MATITSRGEGNELVQEVQKHAMPMDASELTYDITLLKVMRMTIEGK
jgi:hypothetical protein